MKLRLIYSLGFILLLASMKINRLTQHQVSLKHNDTLGSDSTEVGPIPHWSSLINGN